MLVQQVAVKLLARAPVDQEPLIAIFHRWIREASIPEHLLIDVADYRHVDEGPGVMIIAHEAQLGLDEGPPGHGLLYTRRRDEPGEAEGKIREALAWAAFSAALLEQEEGYSEVLSPNDVIISVRSRALTPDTVAAGNELEAVLGRFAEQLWGTDVTVTAEQDPRKLAQVRVRAAGGPSSVAELADRLPVATTAG